MIDICTEHASAGKRQMRISDSLLVDVNGHIGWRRWSHCDAGRHIGCAGMRITVGTIGAYINASGNVAAIGDRHMNMTEWRKARKMIADMRKLAEQLHGEGHDASAAMVRRAMELIDDAFPCFAGNGERLPLKVSA